MFRRSRNQITGTAVAALIGTTLGVGGLIGAQDSPQDLRQHRSAEQEVRVGTYQPQEAFDQFYRTAELQARATELQTQMQEAQQQGDQQRMMAIQAELQQMQNSVIEAFYDEVEQAMPDVAEEADIQIVAIDVVYTAEDIGDPVDVTENLMKKVNANADEADADTQERAPQQPSSGR